MQKIIAGHGSIVRRKFAACAFWILNAASWAALYIGYLRHSELPLGEVAAAALFGLLLQLYCARFHSPGAPIRPRWLSCNVLCALALACWLLSLGFRGLGADQKHMWYGGELLAWGWLGLGQTLAWLANPLFLWTLVRLSTRRRTLVSGPLAFVLALDTWRLDTYLADEGGGQYQVYGYGWGAVLWLLSMTLLLAACGSVRTAHPHSPVALVRPQPWLRPLGLALGVLVVAAAGALAMEQRQIANHTEQAALAAFAFKRDAVCTREVPPVEHPVAHISGPLTLLIEAREHASAYPFEDLEDLLSWGIPAIRVQDRDYQLSDVGGERMMTSVPAAGPTPLGLLIRTDGPNLSALLQAEGGVVLFKQDWKRSPAYGHSGCPDFSPFPAPEQQPRALLTSALGLPAKPVIPFDRYAVADSVDYQGVVTAQGMAAPVDGRSRNPGCPATVGWVSARADRTPDFISRRDGLRIGDKWFFARRIGEPKLFCQTDSAFLYSVGDRTELLTLMIEKRRLSDFQRHWRIFVEVTAPQTFIENAKRGVTLDSVVEQDDQMILQLSDPRDGRQITVVAKPKPGKARR
ncbi:hypothetical protein SFA35_10605 [Pseudomonas sp. HR96]|uniref:hypothetical protein n=1 Tax=Pseudomonas sp. HR96 TaxID=1027966 RepID=UPI002A764060|nr:hypothetical protein [Pseudomonas sp. HR96]WPP01763.1 hypothetical protein SFA35_10605 [Pseudomonas sp. HR96]